MDASRRGSSGRPRFGQGPHAARALNRTIVAAAAIGGRLPARTTAGLAVAGGTLEWALRPRKRRVLAQNLSHALGGSATRRQVRAAVRAEVVNEARRSADFLWSVAYPERAAASTRIEGIEHLHDALASGHGVVLSSPHLGGWEVIVPLASRLDGLAVTALVENDWLAWAVASFRRRARLDVISIGEPPVRALSALRNGGALVILGDLAQPGMRAVEVTLLDARISLPAGPAALSRIAGAPLVPFAVLPIDARSWRLWLGEPIPSAPRGSGRAGETVVTQALADVWTKVLRAHPTQWAAVDSIPWVDTAGR